MTIITTKNCTKCKELLQTLQGFGLTNYKLEEFSKLSKEDRALLREHMIQNNQKLPILKTLVEKKYIGGLNNILNYILDQQMA